MSACCHSDRDCDRKQSGTRCRRRESRGQGRVPRRSPSRPAPRCRSRSVGGAISHAPGDFPELPGASGSAGAPGMTWPTAWPLAPSRSQQRISARGAQAAAPSRAPSRDAHREDRGFAHTAQSADAPGRCARTCRKQSSGRGLACPALPFPFGAPVCVLRYACFDMRAPACVLRYACRGMRTLVCVL